MQARAVEQVVLHGGALSAAKQVAPADAANAQHVRHDVDAV